MGKLEQKSRQRTRAKNLQRVVLGTVAAAGILSVGLLAPNVISALKTLGLMPGRRQKEIVAITCKRMMEVGYLTHNHRGFLKLTPKGEQKLRQLERNDFQIKKPRRWDNKWRILIFDINERRKYLREKVRRTLSAVGFVRLQDSVWVYPYPCDDFITLLKADFAIGKELLYLVVESIENDGVLRQQFGLR